jgi:hypothetical protein
VVPVDGGFLTGRPLIRSGSKWAWARHDDERGS